MFVELARLKSGRDVKWKQSWKQLVSLKQLAWLKGGMEWVAIRGGDRATACSGADRTACWWQPSGPPLRLFGLDGF